MRAFDSVASINTSETIPSGASKWASVTMTSGSDFAVKLQCPTMPDTKQLDNTLVTKNPFHTNVIILKYSATIKMLNCT